MDELSLLKQYFGHSSFRAGQRELIDALLSGRDVLGVMPTGSGKSVCYQIPAMLCSGITLVISPLIALMKDQVNSLVQSGIRAAYINSSLTVGEYRNVLDGIRNGAYKLLYIAPERLQSPDFLHIVRETEISLLAVDEAHCISQWGQDFRPSYLQIAPFIETLPSRPTVGAFTATATDEVRNDIQRLLRLKTPFCLTTGFDRPNLFLDVRHPRDKTAWLLDYILRHQAQSGIVYCATRKAVESICGELRNGGIAATRYHAGLTDEERRKNQEDFVYDRASIMVATNAFGMGIDKSNVGFVIHYNMPKNLESYYQEAGRAGRDGERAECILLYSPGDVQTAKFLINNAAENENLTTEAQEFVRMRNLLRLKHMTQYCKTTDCLRAVLLRYFGEETAARCENCGNCVGELYRRDITQTARKILSGVARVERKYPNGFGITLIVQMLRGSKEQRVLELGLDELSTYGILRNFDRTLIRNYIDYLIREGYLYLDGESFPVLRLTPKANDVLFRNERVIYVGRKAADDLKALPTEIVQKPDGGLYERLRGVRTSISQREHVPPYVVFNNATLTEMAARTPRNMDELLQISGVGEIKAKRYGQEFLSAIALWEQEKDGNEP